MIRNKTLARFLLVAALAALTAGGAVAAEAEEGRKKKADFLTEKEQSFIRPGLQFDITRAWADADGTVRYSFTVKDSAGRPLDIQGLQTAGAINIRSVLSVIPAGQTLHRTYASRQVTSPITGDTAEQSIADAGGRFERTGDGEYTYTFGTRIPSDADRSRTHTVGAWAVRNLSEFDLGIARDFSTFDWVPDGSAEPKVTLSVTDAKCNQCHGEVAAHDNRTGMALCVTCHQPQSTDPDTGNTVDMATMTHKIHMGANLPSVQAGEPYRIIGFRGRVFDYSTISYPADVRNCQTCHAEEPGAIPAPLTSEIAPTRSRSSARAEGVALARLSGPAAPRQAGAPDANRHLTNPSRRACGSCHETVNFATGENHANLPQISDNQCMRCHNPQGELEFDLSIKGAHTIPRFSQNLPGTRFEILAVANTAPGQRPTVSFKITNDAGEPVEPAVVERLALVMGASQGGDFSEFSSESATAATGSNGIYSYTFQNTTIPEDARGTWAVGIEGFQRATLLAGTRQERTVSDAGENDVFYFNVGGGPASPRRTVVSQQKCDSCHYDLSIHSSRRNEVEYCVICHNPNMTDIARRPESAGAAESINFKDMIHRIHAGEAQEREITIYASRAYNFNEVRYPRSTADCSACHTGGSEALPLAADLLPTVDPRGFFNPALPATAACLGCHTSLTAAAHADLNISGSFGESCAVCHGPGSQFDVQKVHAR